MKTVTVLSEMNSGYKGSPEKWQQFLLAWSNKRKELEINYEYGYKDGNITDDFTIPSLDVAQIQHDILAAEQRLGFKLPKSYCDFMLATNGQVPNWCFEGSFAYGKMLSLQEIDKAKYIDPEFVGYAINEKSELYQEFEFEDVDDLYQNKAEYYRYDAFQEAVYVEFLPELLQLNLTNPELVVLLLNEKEQTMDGEFQGYTLCHKELGAYRFISFAHMMMNIYISNVDPKNRDAWYDYRYDRYGIAKVLFE